MQWCSLCFSISLRYANLRGDTRQKSSLFLRKRTGFLLGISLNFWPFVVHSGFSISNFQLQNSTAYSSVLNSSSVQWCSLCFSISLRYSNLLRDTWQKAVFFYGKGLVFCRVSLLWAFDVRYDISILNFQSQNPTAYSSVLSSSGVRCVFRSPCATLTYGVVGYFNTSSPFEELRISQLCVNIFAELLSSRRSSSYDSWVLLLLTNTLFKDN